MEFNVGERAMRIGNPPWPSFLQQRPLTCAAFECAVVAHEGQRREADNVAYVLHPLEVAAMLDVHGFDDRVTAAAVLHDTLEDTKLSPAELEERFGAHVAGLVRGLTEDDRVEGEPERKAALREQVFRLDGEVGAVFAADKLSKVRELRIRLSSRLANAADDEVRSKLDHYQQSLRVLEASMAGDSLVRHLRFELEALYAQPPHGQHFPASRPAPNSTPTGGPAF